MAAGPTFPAFLKIQANDGGSFPELVASAKTASGQIKQTFEVSADAIGAAIRKAVTMPPTQSGTVDLGVAKYEDAARKAEMFATQLRQVADAAEALSIATGDSSATTSRYILAAQAAAREAGLVASATAEEAAIMQQLQSELLALPVAHRAATVAAEAQASAMRAVGSNSNSMRFAGIMAAQQVQDMTVQFQTGTRASIIMAEQLPQLAFALSMVEGEAGTLAGRVGALGRFFAGGWGTAIFIAVAAVGALTTAFGENEKASKEAEKAAQEFAQRQLDIANFFDLSTGKIREQNAELIRNAVLLRKGKIDDLQKKVDEGTKGAFDAARQVADDSVPDTFVERGMSIKGYDPAISAAIAQANGDVHKLDDALFALGQRRPDLKPLIEQVNTAGATAIDAGRQISKLHDEIGSLESGKLAQSLLKPGSGGGTSTRLLDAQAKYNAADSGTEKAQAHLQLVKAENAELLKQGKITRDIYESRVQAAEEEVQSEQRIDATGRALTKAQREAARLADFGDRAAEKIAGINAEWDNQPRLIDRATLETRKLDKLIASLYQRKPPGYEQLVAAAMAAEGTINDGRQRPYVDYLEQQSQQLEIQRLINSGRAAEASALQDILGLQRQMGPLTEYQRQRVLEMAAARQQEAEAAELERARQQTFLNALQQTQQVIAQSIATLRGGGLGNSLKSLVGGLGSTLDNLVGDYVTNTVFGPAFQALSDQVKGSSPLDKANLAVAGKVDTFSSAVVRMTSSADDVPNVTDRMVRSLNRLVDALDTTAGRLPGATNDSGLVNIGFNGVTALDRVDLPYDKKTGQLTTPDIVVLGDLERAIRDPFSFGGKGLAELIGKPLHLSQDTIDAMGAKFGTAIEGLYVGQVAGGLILGSSGDKTGEALGGTLGDFAGKELTKGLKGVLGSIGGPVGAIAGGVLGGLVGSLFHSAKQGGVTLNGSGSGTSFGNSAAATKNAGSLASSVQSGLQNVIDQLGGTLGSYLVSIGTYNGKYRVNPNGGTKLGGGHGKLGNVDFGDDQDAAIQYAILNAIQDGAVKGIDAGAQRLLQAGTDLSTQLQKALSFEQVFKDLKSHTDPVGAAIDEVNTKFENLKKIFAEAGASAEQYAQLQQEYDYERADAIKQATQQTTGSLKDLLDNLTTGDNGRSLRDRIAAAQAAYAPLASQIAAGDYSNSDEYSSAAQTLLGLTQQLDGSQQGYFTLLDQITSLTQTAVTSQQKLIDNATNASTPFSDVSGTTAVTGSINDMNSSLSGQLAAVNKNLGTLIAQNDNRNANMATMPVSSLNF